MLGLGDGHDKSVLAPSTGEIRAGKGVAINRTQAHSSVLCIFFAGTIWSRRGTVGTVVFLSYRKAREESRCLAENDSEIWLDPYVYSSVLTLTKWLAET